MPSLRRSLGLLLVLAAVCAATAAARADATADLTKAAITNSKLHSYHIEMQQPGVTSRGDFESPGRMHLVMGSLGETIVIGDTMYMKMNGAWKKYPASGMASLGVTDIAKEMQARRGEFAVADLGNRTVDGVSLHAYSVIDKKRSSTDLVYVDSGGRIARMEVGKSIVRFSAFDEPVDIKAPM